MTMYKGLPTVIASYPLDSQALDILHKQFHRYLGIYPQMLAVRVSLTPTRLNRGSAETNFQKFSNKLQQVVDKWLREEGVEDVCKLSFVFSSTQEGRLYVTAWFNLSVFQLLTPYKVRRLIQDWFLLSWARSMNSWPEQIRHLVKYPKQHSFIPLIPGTELYKESVKLAFYHMTSLTKQMISTEGELLSNFRFMEGYTTWFGNVRNPRFFHCKRGNIEFIQTKPKEPIEYGIFSSL